MHTRMSHLANSSIVTSGSTGSVFGALLRREISSSSASVLSRSRRGKSVSPLWTRISPRSVPKAVSSQPRQSCAPICPSALSQLSGMKGVRQIRQMRSDSTRLYMTSARRGAFASSFARTQGIVSSMYLFARWMQRKTSSSARCGWRASICAAYFSGRARSMTLSSSSIGSALRAAGRTPPKYFSTIAVVRDTRLPRSLARSVLIVEISSSLEKLPSEPKGKVRSRKKRSASTPNFSERI